MKTKLTLLLTTLAVAGIASFAYAGPDLQTQGLRKQIADSQRTARTVVSDSGPVHYVANPSGKGGTVVPAGESTSIALFKSSKAKGCDGSACCSKMMKH